MFTSSCFGLIRRYMFVFEMSFERGAFIGLAVYKFGIRHVFEVWIDG